MPTALVFGASGISGWGLLKHCLTDPTPDYWTRIIGLTNRPMTLEAAALPNDPRYQLVHGIDLLAGADAVIEKLKGVEGIEEVETVFFCGAYHSGGGKSTSL
jgi:nucleoside-diphosphate-sugar epimerase